jgi:membrane fusion protein (multidrug efflux system)
MFKRMFLMLAVMIVFLTAIGTVKYMQVKAAVAQFASFQPPPEAVTTIVARQDRWPAVLGSIGTVAAVRGVTVSADLPGIVDQIAFDSGRTVKEGDVLVQLDTRQERAQLAAAEAQRDLSHANLDRFRDLIAQRVVAQSEYDQAEADYKRAEANVVEIHATIGRKTIRAPFSGVLGIRQANLGQYLAGGAPIVPLQSLDPVYVNFSVPQQHLARLRTGTSVRVSIESSDAEAPGRVTAIDSVVDEGTRNVQVQATLPNAGARFRPGMFVQTKIALGADESVVTLPASAINYAPYGDSVFVVANLKGPKGNAYQGVEQRFVKLGAARGDQIAVLSGVKAGEEVVTSGLFKLRNGAAVQINNKVQPSNNPRPRPQES